MSLQRFVSGCCHESRSPDLTVLSFSILFKGFLAGFSMFFYKSTTISMYLFSKLVEVRDE